MSPKTGGDTGLGCHQMSHGWQSARVLWYLSPNTEVTVKYDYNLGVSHRQGAYVKPVAMTTATRALHHPGHITGCESTHVTGTQSQLSSQHSKSTQILDTQPTGYVKSLAVITDREGRKDKPCQPWLPITTQSGEFINVYIITIIYMWLSWLLRWRSVDVYTGDKVFLMGSRGLPAKFLVGTLGHIVVYSPTDW